MQIRRNALKHLSVEMGKSPGGDERVELWQVCGCVCGERRYCAVPVPGSGTERKTRVERKESIWESGPQKVLMVE